MPTFELQLLALAARLVGASLAVIGCGVALVSAAHHSLSGERTTCPPPPAGLLSAHVGNNDGGRGGHSGFGLVGLRDGG